jgi:hypothetical protein
MPLMSRRRSTLDNLLSDIRSNTQENAPSPNPASGYTTPVPNTNRPMSAQEPLSPVDVLSLGPPSPPVQTATPATARFSMLRWRHFSDGQLSAKARLHADSNKTPPVPQVPLEHQSQSTYKSPFAASSLLTSIFSSCAKPANHHYRPHHGRTKPPCPPPEEIEESLQAPDLKAQSVETTSRIHRRPSTVAQRPLCRHRPPRSRCRCPSTLRRRI